MKNERTEKKNNDRSIHVNKIKKIPNQLKKERKGEVWKKGKKSKVNKTINMQKVKKRKKDWMN